MDNNQDFKKQFMQNVKNASQNATTQSVKPQVATPQPAAPVIHEEKTRPSLSLIISIILAIVVVLQSIALIIVINNHFAMFSGDTEEVGEETETEGEEDTPYVYDDENTLIAMEATCTAEDGSYLHLTKNNNFEEYKIVSPSTDSNSHVTKDTGEATPSLVDSGSYSITRDSVFTFKKSSGEKTYFFDGYTLTDNTVFYDCEDVSSSEGQE